MKILMYITFVFALLLFYSSAKSQVVINEFSAANSNIITDDDYNDYADWIELYNAGAEAVNLYDYYLSDNFNEPNKWSFPLGLIIPPEGFLLVWADGMDSSLHANFKLSAEGEQLILSDANLNLIDSVSFGPQKTNVSFGRKLFDVTQWGYYDEPTPNAINNTTQYERIIYQQPIFSLRGGMYLDKVDVELSNYQEGTIRYTLDGSAPNEQSILYSEPIAIESTKVLRASVFNEGCIVGPIISNTYFINENSTLGKLPVISIATDDNNFWDAEKGIYVQDFKPLWEVPINVEFFANNGSDRAEFNELAGCKVNGLWSWQLPQKMLGLYFRKQYGTSNLDYPLFSQRKRSSYKSFALRASGSDWSYTLFRDILGQHATLFNMDLDIMSFKPAVVYVNGEFLGIHNMREKVDDDYIEKSYGMPSGSFDLIENEYLVEAGDITAYNLLLAELDKDLSVDANFDAVAELMDVQNFTDFVITEMAVANTSISHNIMAWKPKESGKWRWILMDLDRGFFKPTQRPISFYIGQDVIPLNELLNNDTYKQYFAQRMCDQLFTSFHPDRMKDLISEHRDLIADEMPQHIERWEGTTSDYGNAMPSVSYWEEEVQDLNDFVEARPFALLSDLQNYGFSGYSNLSIATLPVNAAAIHLNGLALHQSNVSGFYLNDMEFELEVQSKPGYNFTGWTKATRTIIIDKESLWKYNDAGEEMISSWTQLSFNDSEWSEGNGELGYGDGDENTSLSYGGDAQNKHITTYFRKTFSLSDEQLSADSYTIKLLRDDGAIVYLNDEELIRSNMNDGVVDFTTTSSSSVTGDSESLYYNYNVPNDLFRVGNNVLAVEVHQASAASSDVSFDLALETDLVDPIKLLSNEESITATLNKDESFVAIFEESGDCILPQTINEDFTLNAACSPYLVQGDVTVSAGVQLSIEAGVEVWMPEGASIIVNGCILANGTAEEPIVFKPNPTLGVESWGILNFKNTIDTSILKYVTIEGASQGSDPVIETAAISAFNAILVMDNLTLLSNYGNPISARFSDVSLTNSVLHSDITGDLINVKYGKAIIENCEFIGNDQPDTDAIDYDEVEDGIIQNCTISDFVGFNSDAVDIGEQAQNVFINKLTVNSVSDKGVSVGQQSTVSIHNSVFTHCNLGIGVKDSSWAIVNQSTFYANGNAIACFEKNLGQAGGNALVTNSILSNSHENVVFVDAKSTLTVSYSLSDDGAILGEHNLNDNPLFQNSTQFNFNLQQQSPAIDAGIFQDKGVDMGAPYFILNWSPEVMIVQLFVNPLNLDHAEFITLYNPSAEPIDLSGYTITKGVTATFPEGTILNASDSLYVTNNKYSDTWWQQEKQVVQWQEGHLSNNGEAIQLENTYNMVVDYIAYNEEEWPDAGFIGNNVLELENAMLDNHLAEHWTSRSIGDVVGNTDEALLKVKVFPNPTTGMITIQPNSNTAEEIHLCNVHGQVIETINFPNADAMRIDLSKYSAGVYYVMGLGEVVKIIKVN